LPLGEGRERLREVSNLHRAIPPTSASRLPRALILVTCLTHE